MKKNKFILISSIGTFFLAAVFAYAADVKTAPSSPGAVKTVSGAANIPIKKNPVPVVPAAANVPVKKNPVPSVPAAANVPVQNQAQPAPAPAVTTDQNKATSAAAPPATPAPSYSYNPMDKPDPFKPFIEIEKIEKKKAEKKAPDSIFPLQRAEADSYRVVGIAGTPEKRVAIVEDAAKKFYPLVQGTRIGLYDGKVVEITADRVIVEEYEDKKARRVILKLRKN
ncbi:MAG TPA: pilus assembly protein PilP [Smithella sp.]|nr:pilus assembly protein PilP [Smithella sp.]HOG91056.1 pilus assembly protein PilP [Smithella sp.]HQH16813.1 pilus assembly protein PilP [Smithella sp.]